MSIRRSCSIFGSKSGQLLPIFYYASVCYNISKFPTIVDCSNEEKSNKIIKIFEKPTNLQC